jgi:hypothetical protein
MPPVLQTPGACIKKKLMCGSFPIFSVALLAKVIISERYYMLDTLFDTGVA